VEAISVALNRLYLDELGAIPHYNVDKALLIAATGYLGASRILRNGVVGSLGPALFLMVAVRLLYGLTLALMQTRAARSLRIVRLQPNSVHRSVERVLSGWAGWPGSPACCWSSVWWKQPRGSPKA
jgi:hypothetical protein